MSEEINSRGHFRGFNNRDEMYSSDSILCDTQIIIQNYDNPGLIHSQELCIGNTKESNASLDFIESEISLSKINMLEKSEVLPANSGSLVDKFFITGQPEVIVNQNSEDVYEDRFKIDRQKLEELLQSDKSGEMAEEFFNTIMKETSTQIIWPSKLKIGAKSKKDPHIKVSGLQTNVIEAKNLILSKLTTRNFRVTLKMDVPHQCHSHVIGKSGNNIQKVMQETNCHIHFPDSNRNNQTEKSNQVSVTGMFPAIEIARRKIRDLQPLIFTFDLPALNGSQIDILTFSELLQQRYSITITIRSPHQVAMNGGRIGGKNGNSIFCVVIRCCAFSAGSAHRAAIDIFEKFTGRSGVAFCVTLTLDISSQHLHTIMQSPILRWIMQVTGTNIHLQDFKNPLDRKVTAFPIILNAYNTSVSENNTMFTIQQQTKTSIQISGSLPNTVTARKYLLDCLPLTLMMEAPEDLIINQDDLTRISTQYEVQIGIKLKPKQSSKSIMLKSSEGNVSNMFASRFVLLNLPQHNLNIFDSQNTFQSFINYQLNGEPQPSLPFTTNSYATYTKKDYHCNIFIKPEHVNVSPAPSTIIFPSDYKIPSLNSIGNTHSVTNSPNMNTQNYSNNALSSNAFHSTDIFAPVNIYNGHSSIPFTQSNCIEYSTAEIPVNGYIPTRMIPTSNFGNILDYSAPPIIMNKNDNLTEFNAPMFPNIVNNKNLIDPPSYSKMNNAKENKSSVDFKNDLLQSVKDKLHEHINEDDYQKNKPQKCCNNHHNGFYFNNQQISCNKINKIIDNESSQDAKCQLHFLPSYINADLTNVSMQLTHNDQCCQNNNFINNNANISTLNIKNISNHVPAVIYKNYFPYTVDNNSNNQDCAITNFENVADQFSYIEPNVCLTKLRETKKNECLSSSDLSTLLQWLNCQQEKKGEDNCDSEKSLFPMRSNNLEQVQLGCLISSNNNINNRLLDVDCGDSIGSSSSGSSKAPGNNRPRKNQADLTNEKNTDQDLPNIKPSGLLMDYEVDYNILKQKAENAMQKKPIGELRFPTDFWSGLGFSKSMPQAFIAQKMAEINGVYNAICMTSHYEECEDVLLQEEAVEHLEDCHIDSHMYKPDVIDIINNFTQQTKSLSVSQNESTLKNNTEVKISDWCDLDPLFHELGLTKYTSLFKQQEVDMATFLTLTDQDLKELGVSTFGARRKMLLAIADINKKQASLAPPPGLSFPFREAVSRKAESLSQTARW